MFGFACNETEELMPLPIILAHKLTKRLAEVRKKGIIKGLGPDGKSQVSVKYIDDNPVEITNIVIAQQHLESTSIDKLREEIRNLVIIPICQKWVNKDTKIHINATGRFVIGGPEADTGLTGRKIILDTYGGAGRHGGGAFSGKDSSKVDRSGAYMARYVAKKIFDFRPRAIIEHLKLKRPIFQKTASYGHFGRSDFPWEQTDKIEELRRECYI